MALLLVVLVLGSTWRRLRLRLRLGLWLGLRLAEGVRERERDADRAGERPRLGGGEGVYSYHFHPMSLKSALVAHSTFILRPFMLMPFSFLHAYSASADLQ